MSDLPLHLPPWGNNQGWRGQQRGRTCPDVPQVLEASLVPGAWSAGVGSSMCYKRVLLPSCFILSHKNKQIVVILISLVLILEATTKTQGLVFREYRLGLSLVLSNRDSAFCSRESISHPEILRDNSLSTACSEERLLLP